MCKEERRRYVIYGTIDTPSHTKEAPLRSVAQGKRRQRGFTLIELMIALVVVSIVALVFLWSGNSLTRTYRIRDSVRQALGAINYARMQAAIRNQNYRMQFCAYNTNCTVEDHNNLNAFNAVTPALAGFWFIEQCQAGRITTDVCGDPGRGQELKFYDFSRAYRDVEMYQLNVEGNKVNRLMLYFKPNGEIQSCTKSGATITCSRGTYHICFRVSKSAEASGINSFPRRLEISFSGALKLQVEPPPGPNQPTGICAR